VQNCKGHIFKLCMYFTLKYLKTFILEYKLRVEQRNKVRRTLKFSCGFEDEVIVAPIDNGLKHVSKGCWFNNQSMSLETWILFLTVSMPSLILMISTFY
jgi:hypothetical protein